MSADGLRLVLLADTHVPRRARDLPAAVWDAVDGADVVVHAGDWVDVALLDALESRARRLVACYGNNDGPALRARLPLVAHADLGGVRIGVVHETGSAAGREARCDAAHPGLDVLVFGHSHIPWDTVTPAGAAAAQPRIADRPAPATGVHLDERDGRGRTADGRHPAPAVTPGGPAVTEG